MYAYEVYKLVHQTRAVALSSPCEQRLEIGVLVQPHPYETRLTSNVNINVVCQVVVYCGIFVQVDGYCQYVEKNAPHTPWL